MLQVLSKTDFILSAKIMTIALAQITSDSLLVTGSALALVAIGITALVYGSVAILVKAYDLGLRMTQMGRWSMIRSFGVGIIKAMPSVLTGISAIGMRLNKTRSSQPLTHPLPQSAAGLGRNAIQVASGLVRQHQFWTVHQGASNSNTLLLAARQLGRCKIDAVL